jgi:hypothetical protein
VDVCDDELELQCADLDIKLDHYEAKINKIIKQTLERFENLRKVGMELLD